jgi:hypothetical protein
MYNREDAAAVRGMHLSPQRKRTADAIDLSVPDRLD